MPRTVGTPNERTSRERGGQDRKGWQKPEEKAGSRSGYYQGTEQKKASGYDNILGMELIHIYAAREKMKKRILLMAPIHLHCTYCCCYVEVAANV